MLLPWGQSVTLWDDNEVPARLLQGDCVEVMRSMPQASIDAVVCDPPYGLEFMGKEWDRLGDVGKTSHKGFAEKPGFKGFRLASYSGSSNLKCGRCAKWKWDHEGRKCECGAAAIWPNIKAHQGALMQAWHQAWATEALRVLKPGGHLLAFGGTRTSHRLVSALEDAGFEIRDSLHWVYGSGFPKSLNVEKKTGDPTHRGRGTALKPAHEPIVLARKPLAGTVAKNVVAHGTGALSIDACRVEVAKAETLGRWPANFLLSHHPECRCDGATKVKGITGGTGNHHGTVSEKRSNVGDPVKDYAEADGTETVANWACVEGCPVAALDQQSGDSKSRIGKPRGAESAEGWGMTATGAEYADAGGASRFFTQTRWDPIYDVPFFYCAKAAKKEREAGCAGLAPEKQDPIRQAGDPGGDNPRNRGAKKRLNNHPTVKPVGIMRWLVRLVTPPGGVVLDPFAGSGTTLIACCLEGFDSLGIEQDTHYIEIAEKRIAHWQENRGA